MKHEKKMTQDVVLRRVKGLEGKQRGAVVCALVGHSKIIEMCAGYVSCARCEATIGDRLGGCFDTTRHVIVGHNCKECRKNYKSLTWTDKLFAKNPFSEARAALNPTDKERQT